MKKIYIIAPLPAISKRVRLFKLVNYLRSKYPEIEIVHLGWSRKSNDHDEIFFDFNISKEILVSGGGYGGALNKILYIVWMWKVFWRTFRISEESSIWALGLESAIPLYFVSKFTSRRYYFDDPDRLLLLMRFPKPLKSILSFLERRASENSLFHIIPGLERYNYYSSKFVVIKNYPSLREVEEGNSIANSLPNNNSNQLVVNVNGWLAADRGLDTLLNVAKRLKGEKIKFLCYGKIDGDIAKEFVRLENVDFLGHVSNAMSIAYMFVSDIVFTFYKPDSVINRFAESNKWGDALLTECLILVNSEVETAKDLIDSSVAISCPYHDEEGLYKILIELSRNSKRLEEYRSSLISYKKNVQPYENQISAII